jgi:hypothetical protein
MAKDPPLSCVSCLVYATMGIEHIFRGRKDGIKLRFPNVRVEAVYLLESGIAIDGEAIWTKTNELACTIISLRYSSGPCS